MDAGSARAARRVSRGHEREARGQILGRVRAAAAACVRGLLGRRPGMNVDAVGLCHGPGA